METAEFGETDLRAVIEGDRFDRRNEEKSFEKYGYSKQEFKGDELVNVDEEEPETEMDTDDFLDELE